MCTYYVDEEHERGGEFGCGVNGDETAQREEGPEDGCDVGLVVCVAVVVVMVAVAFEIGVIFDQTRQTTMLTLLSQHTH